MVTLSQYLKAQECKDDIDLVALFNNMSREQVGNLYKSEYDKLLRNVPVDELTVPLTPVEYSLDDITVNQWFILQTEDNPILKLAPTLGFSIYDDFTKVMPVVQGFLNACVAQQHSGLTSLVSKVRVTMWALRLRVKLLMWWSKLTAWCH